MTWFPMHSWHPVMVHLPLVGLASAVAFDLVASRTRTPRWRDAATVLWWVGLLGAAAAITTGLLAYNRVEHSDMAHEEMILHRNLALASIGAVALGGVGYLGGDLVYRYGLGIPTETLEEIAHERGGHAHGHAAESAHPDSTAEHHHD